MQPSITAKVIYLLVKQCQTAAGSTTHNLLPSILAMEPFCITPIADDETISAPISSNDTCYTHTFALPAHLSPQEEKVFALLRQGQRNKQIADHLAISPYTVGKHVQNILRKLGVVNRTQAAAYPLK